MIVHIFQMENAKYDIRSRHLLFVLCALAKENVKCILLLLVKQIR